MIVGPMFFADAKMDRAALHLNEIEAEAQRIIKDGAYVVTKKDNVKKFRHIIRYELKPIPTLLGLLAGEFAYCIRSGLDQLAWQLALVHVGKAKRPRGTTSFPIRGKPPDPVKGFGDAIKDILPAAFTVIESLQPYHRGPAYKRDPLWIINELCITDKHVIMPVNSTDSKFRLFGNTSEWSRRDFQHAVEISVSLSDKFKINIQEETSEIVLGEPYADSTSSGFEVRVTQLRPIYDFVRNDVLPRFAGFLK
jgi:hypothetical protein